jgi:CoA:oxalate CoA-transferase
VSGWLPRHPDAVSPLAGLRVLDLSELLPGPFMTQSLAELGADVLKVERPPHGDPLRRSAPALFVAVNRGKRMLQADLKSDEGRARVLALADEADVLVESYRPGVVARLGLDPATLHRRNPGLVVVSLSGYGAHGPRAQWPGHDINYLAAAGVAGMAMKGGGAPSLGVPIADLAGATYALAALQAALLQRTRTGRGQHLDVSLTDCAAHWMNPRLAALHDNGGDAARVRRQVQQRPGYGVFRCRDDEYISIAALEDHFWQALVHTLPLPAFDAKSRYADRVPQAAAINDAIAAALVKEDMASALDRLAGADVPVAEVIGLAQVSRSETLVARRLFVETDVGPLARFPVVLEGMAVA